MLADNDDSFDFLASLSDLRNANSGHLQHEVDMVETPAPVLQDHDDEEEENSKHELPFKVMGATGTRQSKITSKKPLRKCMVKNRQMLMCV